AKLTQKRPQELIGEIIDKDLALQLISGFKENFPGEVSKMFIKTSTIFDAVKNLANVSGIRFMYGMESVNDPGSKVLLLIPGNNISPQKAIPNSIIQPEGYLNNRGERVSLKRTWELLYNHAVHYSNLLPEQPFRHIVRGVFFGIDSLKYLLQERTQAYGINYHFGYDDTVSNVALRFKAVLQPVRPDLTIYNNDYMDLGSICPPNCPCYPWPECVPPNPPDTCVSENAVHYGGSHLSKTEQEAEAELNIYRKFRDNYFLQNSQNGPLIEMYYYVSPALTEAIENTGRKSEIYLSLYLNQVSACNRLLEEKKYEEAKVLFEKTIADLVQEYLIKQ
ncbi:MAG: hypothetical protein J7497_16650, partial [Chitinophagaceae bacterium]|nr:hypothetical protein [Chitinophagaceae bacterium]